MTNSNNRFGTKIIASIGFCAVLLIAGIGAHVFGKDDTELHQTAVPEPDSVEIMTPDVSTTTTARDVLSKPIPMTVIFVGDMLFDRHIRRMSIKHGEDYIFSCLGDLLTGADMVVGNLEGPITNNPSRSMGTAMGVSDNYVFTFPTSTATLLSRHNVTIVNLGNNHIGNFGAQGISETKKYLDDAGVAYFGGLVGDEPVLRRDTLSLVSYNQFGGQSAEQVASRIAQEKNNGQRVIVYTHWGEEYATSSGYLNRVATLFVEQGADAVFGSHPHVIIPMEYINEVPVYYSLGNFIFDQYFNEMVTTGLVVRVTISDDGSSIEEYKVTMGLDGRTCPTVVSIGE